MLLISSTWLQRTLSIPMETVRLYLCENYFSHMAAVLQFELKHII